MNRQKAEYKTRNPQPTSRDPVLTPDIPPPLDHALRMEVELPKCARCGDTRFCRNNNTRPVRPEGKMIRRKQCSNCGQWWVQVSDPTRAELAKFWPKATK